MMPYAQVDDAGNVTGLFAVPQAFFTTFMADDDPRVVAFQEAAQSTVEISRRQFYEQLAVQGVITTAEATAAMQGTIPAKLQQLVTQLPQNLQFDATMKLSGATSFFITNPLVQQIGASFGWTSAQVQTFWDAAAAL